MLYNQANVISPDRDFSNQVFTRSMYVWQNSLGNTHYPANKGNDAQFYLVFFIWGFQQFFMVIILLNFLIAVISQSYENVMSKKLIKKYLQKAELIIEAYQFIDALNTYFGIDFHKHPLIKNNKVLLSIFTKDEHDEDEERDEWLGFVATIKVFLKAQLQKIQCQIGAENKEMVAKVKAEVAKLENQVVDVKTRVEGQMADLKAEVRGGIADIKAENAKIECQMAEMRDDI